MDEYGSVAVYLMPYVRTEAVSALYPGEKIESCQEAVSCLLAHTERKEGERSILVAHQFVVNQKGLPETCDSETLSLGGAEAVDLSCLEGFSYVALGHLHGPQKIGRDTVRYAGSPLKYSFSEERHRKSAVLLDLLEDGSVETELLPLYPVHEMRTVKGPLELLMAKEVLSLGDREDYIRAVVTDETEQTDVLGRLRAVYPNLMELALESRKYWEIQSEWGERPPIKRKPMELFEEFYAIQNGHPMEDEEKKLLTELERGLSGKGEKE